jgi:hypothetical protein|tara:strand:+ start:18839 stop:19633 length:795 start_codon:yes stop_codon:yes gene_type:complete
MSKTIAPVGGIKIINTRNEVFLHNHIDESREGHILGARLIHPSLNEGCILIPKSASSSLKNIGFDQNYEWLQNTYEYNPTFRFMATIREPWERYISGFYEYLSRSMSFENIFNLRHHPESQLFIPDDHKFKASLYWRPPGSEELLGGKIKRFCDNALSNNKILFDEHTMPQYYFLKPFIENPITIIKMECIHKHYPLWFGKDYDPHHTYQRSEEYVYTIIKDYLNEKRKNDKEWFETWSSYFEGDYELYNLDSGKEYRILLNRS